MCWGACGAVSSKACSELVWSQPLILDLLLYLLLYWSNKIGPDFALLSNWASYCRLHYLSQYRSKPSTPTTFIFNSPSSFSPVGLFLGVDLEHDEGQNTHSCQGAKKISCSSSSDMKPSSWFSPSSATIPLIQYETSITSDHNTKYLLILFFCATSIYFYIDPFNPNPNLTPHTTGEGILSY